jgi:hypothetical protein
MLRPVISLAACLAILVSGVLGLSRGMVLCYDGAGHLALEAAHALHTDSHEQGGDHAHHESPAGGDHTELHAAQGECSDASLGSVTPRPSESGAPRAVDLAAAPFAAVVLPDLRPPVGPAGTVTGHFWGSAGRVELACIRATVLLV